MYKYHKHVSEQIIYIKQGKNKTDIHIFEKIYTSLFFIIYKKLVLFKMVQQKPHLKIEIQPLKTGRAGCKGLSFKKVTEYI